MTGRPLAGFLLALLTAGGLFADDPRTHAVGSLTRLTAADDPRVPDAKTFDKMVVDTLREVHNKGADLYNTSKDFAGTYRMYQGALITVRPMLSYRPAAQKMIDDGLKAAETEPSVAQKAFKLHEAIESVRTYLKSTAETSKKSNEPKKSDEKKNPDPINPKPKGTGTDTPPPAGKSGLSGKVTFQGKPLAAGEFTVVSLDQAKPRVFTTTIQPDGSYAFTEPIPPGRYVVMVAGKTVPAKYQSTTTSGLTIEVGSGGGNHDVELK